MSKPYYQVIQLNIFDDPAWLAYAHGEGPLPPLRHSADVMAILFYYLGDTERAETLSYHASMYYENLAQRRGSASVGLRDLFQAALFRSLANRSDEARLLWERIIAVRRKLDPTRLLADRRADYWIYEVYALAKLQRYTEVAEPAEQGFKGIHHGKGIDPIPYRNSLEYGLAAVLTALATYYLDQTPAHQQSAQKALMRYKDQNTKHGKLGYRVIFDLQRSYPHLFTPVLPGPTRNRISGEHACYEDK